MLSHAPDVSLLQKAAMQGMLPTVRSQPGSALPFTSQSGKSTEAVKLSSVLVLDTAIKQMNKAPSAQEGSAAHLESQHEPKFKSSLDALTSLSLPI